MCALLDSRGGEDGTLSEKKSQSHRAVFLGPSLFFFSTKLEWNKGAVSGY